MLIIVEGPDGTGKTTLVRRLAEALRDRAYDVRVLRAGPPTGHPLDEYVLPLLDHRPGFGAGEPAVVCDRWHLGELVYPTLLDRPTRMTAAVLRYVELFLASRGAVVVHVNDTPEALTRVLTRRGDDLVRPHQAEGMLSLFRAAVAESALPVVDVEARDSSVEVVTTVVNAAMFAFHDAWPLAGLVTYVGGRWPRYLLVGDVRGVGGDPHALRESGDLRPAFMPYENTCGEYLLRSLLAVLPQHGPPRRLADVGIVNANDVDNIYTAHRTLGGPRVVALGRRAESTVRRWLATREHDVDYAPHPQYWKRFHHADHETYGKTITGSWEL